MGGPEHDVGQQAAEPAQASSGGLAAAAGGGLTGEVLRMRAQMGNAAISRLLQRDPAPPDSSSAGGVGTPAPAPPTQGSSASSAGGVPAPAPAANLQDLIDAKDISGIKGIKDFSPATPQQRVQLIEILLDQFWVGPYDEWAIEAIWECWGTAGIVQAYADHQALWDRCVEAGAELPGLKALAPIRDQFEPDVKALAHLYMKQNDKAVLAEAERLNLGHLNDPFEIGGPKPPPDREKVIEVQQLAAEIQRADDAIAALSDIPVGLTDEQADSSGASPALISRFVPGTPPRHEPPAGQETNFRRYDDVMAQYRSATAARALLASKNPALFAASSTDGEAGRIAKLTPEQAAARLRDILGATRQHIEDTLPKLDSGDLDWRDLTPIHKQLWEGMPAQSGRLWSEKLNKLVAEDVIGSYKAKEFWVTLGLGTLAAAAFIFSEIATGGMATFLWASAASIGVGVAGHSWEKYEVLATAAGSATSEDTRLVTGEQVNDAKVAAILDTIFAFIDVFQAAKGIATAARATAARKGLEGLATLGKDEAALAVQNAVKDLGPAETIRRAPGKSLDELVALAGGETSDAGKALRKAAEDVSVADPLSIASQYEAADKLVPASEAGRRIAAASMPVFERWARLSPLQRLEALIEHVNNRLAELGCPPVKCVIEGGSGGSFRGSLWRIRVSGEVLEKAAVTEAEFAELVNVVAHEGEHAEQWFKMAQLEAATTNDVAALALKQKIPENVAKAAIDVESGAAKGVKLAASGSEAEARLYFESVYGAGKPERKRVLDALKTTDKAVDDTRAAADGLSGLAEDNIERMAAEKRWRIAVRESDEAYGAYRMLPEEVAAHRVGFEASAATLERFRLLRDMRQMEVVMNESHAVLSKATDAVAALIGSGADPSTKLATRVAAKQAHDRFVRACAAVESASARLDAAAAGAAP